MKTLIIFQIFSFCFHLHRLFHFIFIGIPTVSSNQTVYSIPYGYSVILHCEISTEPPLTNVYWERLVENKKSIVYSGESGTSGATLNNPSLIINFATLRDEGYYNCFGRNVAGTGNGPQIQLTVTGGKNIKNKN